MVFKNRERVTVRYFHGSTSVFICPESKEYSNWFDYVMLQINEEREYK